MHISVIGLNHKTAPVEIRDRVAFGGDRQKEALALLKAYDFVKESLILSTCNRTEIYAVGDGSKESFHGLVDFLCGFHGLDERILLGHLYTFEEQMAVRHLFRVALSLDSMVLGEPEILGQVKDAYSIALDNMCTGVIFNRLFKKAIEVGKRVRTETEIGLGAVSVGYVAVELAKKIFTGLKGHSALLLGAGEMGELVAKHLVANGVGDIIVANRTFERGRRLAESFGAKAVRFEEGLKYMVKADIVISSTGAPHYVLHQKDVAQLMHRRRNKPLFLVDIAVPRDIDPECGQVYNVFLYDIDDLQSVVDVNLEKRKKEAQKAEGIVEEEVEKFVSWYRGLDAVATINSLRRKVERIREREVARSMSKLQHLSERDRVRIEGLTKSLINKIFHEPTLRLKGREGYSQERLAHIDSIRYLFDLFEGCDEPGSKNGHRHQGEPIGPLASQPGGRSVEREVPPDRFQYPHHQNQGG